MPRRRVARIAVGIAAGDDADAGRLAFGDEGTAVTDALARSDLLDADDLPLAASSPGAGRGLGALSSANGLPP